MNKRNQKQTVLTSGSSLAWNSLFNLIGQVVPLLAAIIAIPMLIHGLGVNRFGVLTLAWMVIGYFSLFDLGLGRALTQLVAIKLGTGEENSIPTLVWTSIVLMFVLGLIGALVLFLASSWLVNVALKIPEELKSEMHRTFFLLAVGIPIVLVTTGLAGVLSALQRFDILNKIRIPMGVYSFFAPLLILPFSQSLYPITAVLVLGRLIACCVYLAACLRVMPLLKTSFNFRLSVVKPLFRFGAWMTVTNVLSPLMVYLDRFAIGGIVSVAAVSYYATPYEMVTKLWIIPYSIVSVLFPAFAESYVQSTDRSLNLFIRGTKYVTLILFPIVLLVVAFAHEGLQIWLGVEFSKNSTSVLQWLSVGVYINSIALVFITLIQAIGRPDLSAKLHILELPIYLPILWWAIHNYGIQGAAITWVGRVTLDGVILFWLSSRFFSNSAVLFKRMAAGMLVALAGVLLPLLVEGFIYRFLIVSLVMLIFLTVAWFIVFATDERNIIKDWFLGYLKRTA